MKKFMQTLSDAIYAKLEELAEKRGISVQELLRAIIIPEWIESQDLSLAGRLEGVSKKFSGPTRRE